MDTTDYPSLPNLARMHSRLAADARRVEQLVASAEFDAIERLFLATTVEDWSGVALACQLLAQLSPTEISPEVFSQAQAVSQELATTTQRTPPHLPHLLAACHAFRTKTRSS